MTEANKQIYSSQPEPDGTIFVIKRRKTPGITFLDQIGTIFPSGALDESGKPRKKLIRPPNLAKLLEEAREQGFDVKQEVWDAVGQAALGIKIKNRVSF